MIKNPPSNGNGQNKPKPPNARGANKPRAPRGERRAMPAAASRPSEVAAAYASGQRSSAPKITATRDQSRIVHRELVTSVIGSTAFAVLSTYALNPGMSNLFNWLSTQAVGWEKYRFNKLCFKYYTRTGSGTPGSCMLAPDYDPADAAPASEVIASAYQSVAEDAPWKNIVCELDPKRFGGEKFIRTGPLAPNLDIKTYDSGQLFLCTVDGTAVPWGKLWVEYDVTLMAPALPASGGALLSSYFTQTVVATPELPFYGMDLIGGSDPGVASISSGGAIIFNKAGRFLVYIAFSSVDADYTVSFPDPTYTLCTSLSTDGVGGGGDASRMLIVQSLGPGAQILSEPVFGAGGTSDIVAILAIAQIPVSQEAFTIAP